MSNIARKHECKLHTIKTDDSSVTFAVHAVILSTTNNNESYMEGYYFQYVRDSYFCWLRSGKKHSMLQSPKKTILLLILYQTRPHKKNNALNIYLDLVLWRKVCLLLFMQHCSNQIVILHIIQNQKTLFIQ